ncbi:hypothetical protein [Hyphobacterium sp.]|uniref:hypothetical protein n=1 Tax=Hyphobacterium sp. TaxID=2004662 RepID=UPI003747F053
MWKSLWVAGLALAFMPQASAQDDRRCCHVSEGVWLDGTYTPAECRARGEDFAPQGDSRTAMCTRHETTEIPPSPPGAPGSPGGGPGGGDGGGGGGSGAGVQMPEDMSLANERFGYETVGSASLSELGTFRDRAFEQRDFCDSLIRGMDTADRAAAQQGQQCFSNLRANANLVAQNAGRMRNGRDMDASEREEAAHIFQSASELRSEADARLTEMGDR